MAHVPQAQTQPGHEGRERDEAGEPEEHRQRVEGDDGVLVRQARQVDGREGEVGRCQEGPDGGEEEEVDLGGGGYAAGVGHAVDGGDLARVVPVGDCRERGGLVPRIGDEKLMDGVRNRGESR